MTRTIPIDDRTVLALERHETLAHAIPDREVRDLGDALLLTDPSDPDPFWNRMVSVRWPSEPDPFEQRLAEALALFLVLGRKPHFWPSPAHNRPPDLVERLVANGFKDVGGGYVMLLAEPSRCPPLRGNELAAGTIVERIRRPADPGAAHLADVAGVLAESFGARPERAAELAVDLGRIVGDPRVALLLVRVDGAPAAVAKATTFDRITYLSSIGTRPAFRGRGLGAVVTREAVSIGREAGADRFYLGVFSGNETAIRLYERLGFASIGESPDMLLE